MNSGGWCLAMGAAILSACVVAPATAHADASCDWSQMDLVPPPGAANAEIHEVVNADPTSRWVLANGGADGRQAAFLWHYAIPRIVRLTDDASRATTSTPPAS